MEEKHRDEMVVKSSDDHQADFDNPLYKRIVAAGSDNDTQVNLFHPERNEDHAKIDLKQGEYLTLVNDI